MVEDSVFVEVDNLCERESCQEGRGKLLASIATLVKGGHTAEVERLVVAHARAIQLDVSRGILAMLDCQGKPIGSVLLGRSNAAAIERAFETASRSFASPLGG
jgi:hypothetical protein